MKKSILIIVMIVTLLLLSSCGNDKDINTLSSAQSDSLTTTVRESEETESTTEEIFSESGEILPADETEPVVITDFPGKIEEQDGCYYTPVKYIIGEEPFSGYMDEKGAIISDIPSDIPSEYNGSRDAKCGGEGIFLCSETESNIDGTKINLGLADYDGSWLYDGPVNILEIMDVNFDFYSHAETHTEYKYLGEKMFSAYISIEPNTYYLFLFNGNDGKCICVEDVSKRFLSFYDGTMIYQQYNGNHLGKICSLESNGTIQELDVQGDLLAVDATGFLTDGNGISFYDRTGNLKWSFDKYTIAKNSYPALYDGLTFAFVQGADGNEYTLSLDSKGELIYEPFETFVKYVPYRTAETVVIGGHYGLKGDELTPISVVDLETGEDISTFELPSGSHLSGRYGSVFVVKSDEGWLLYDITGKQVIPFVK